MRSRHVHSRHEFVPPADDGARHPVVVAGGGLVGLTVALDLASRGQRSVVVEEGDTVTPGSRAVCFARRTLEILSRLGLGPTLLRHGVALASDSIYMGERCIWAADLAPDSGHEYPEFLNLRQDSLEEALVEACQASKLVDLRWRHRLTGVEKGADGMTLGIDTPTGAYRLTADWLLACDGADSRVRGELGLPFLGRSFADHFLVADVAIEADGLAERRFWFDPPFHRGGGVQLHRLSGGSWRVTFQLGAGADPEAEGSPERAKARIAAMLGEGVPFEVEWLSVHTFRCRRMEHFRAGRTLFLGDAAHQVSPFGERGGNGGIQDADNLGWKLLAVLRGEAPDALLDSYDTERTVAADEDILNATRSTDFIAPRGEAARAYRDAVLELAERHDFARPLVNPGRLSRPAVLRSSGLNTPDGPGWAGGLPPGAPAVDAPVLYEGRPDWLLRHLAAGGFSLLLFGPPDEVPSGALTAPARRTRHGGWPVHSIFVSPVEADGVLWDREGLAAARYDAQPGTAVLLRPDQHVAARWRGFDAAQVAAARRRALSITESERLERAP